MESTLQMEIVLLWVSKKTILLEKSITAVEKTRKVLA